MLLLALVVVQFALAWHAQHIAQYAAQDALAATRVEDGTAADGRARARGELASLAHRILSQPSVTVQRTAARASVRVDGTALPVVPGLHLHVAGHASGAVERLTTPTEGRA